MAASRNKTSTPQIDSSGPAARVRRPPADATARAHRDDRAGAPAGAAVEAAQARQRILSAIRAIPRGQVAGYGEVAARAGLPGRARLVARLLSENRDPTLPWHRVLRSDGRIAMPEGSRGWREQSQRLRAEGVAVERGRVKRGRPAGALDAVLWGPRQARL